tara:strand:- start:185 stop:550 length:366 start_codon:yes stop_codon:yes gene_type:complete
VTATTQHTTTEKELMNKSINNIFVFKPTPRKEKPTQVETLTVNHLKSIFNDKNPQACFNNAVSKKVFTEKQVMSDDYIMYMCSDDTYDYFKSKLTKTKYQVKRATVHAQSTANNGHSYVNV